MGAHWLVGIVERAGHACPPPPEGAGIAELWRTVAAAAGMSQDDLARLVSRHFRLEVADLGSAEPAAAKLVPEKVARQFLVFPVREDDRRLVVATADPMDVEAEQMLGFASSRTPVFVVAPPEAIESAINAQYAPDRSVESILRTVDAGAADGVTIIEEAGSEGVGAGEAESAPVVRLTNALFQEAVTHRASDIHLEPGRSGGVIRFRVDGVMIPFMHLPMPALNRVVSRIKILSKLDIADRMRPQDGRTRIRVKEKVYDLRISTVPTREAEKVVIRVLDPQGAVALVDAGLPKPEEAALRRLLSNRDGIVLVTGPTGSGKTTTLYAAIKELSAHPINIMTVEDPVEYELKGITQVQVERKRNVTFASALRAALRQDPDVIMVGEIRDLETAEIAVRASITGHLVLGTLHANDAVASVARLRDLGLDPALLADALRGALAQRLVRRICRACALRVRDEPLNERETQLAALYGVRQEVRARGCEACGNTGYRGRLPVIEVAVITPEIGEMIRQGTGTRQLADAARVAGMRPMRDVAAELVRAGLTTLEEIDRVLGESAQTAPEPVSEPEKAPTVLLVDDDRLVRTLAHQLLERQGYQVIEAADGAAALRSLQEAERVDLMVLDLNMPEMDGRAVLRAVRANPRTTGLPVVVLTGEQQEGMEVQLMDEGADDYIRKPIEPARFVARIKAALRRAGS
jgi:type II secretory ATPase GspE/PulE/Tfp pilus assembly ATPase PilB-like protein/ActR/RegA family two-component response regulator